MLRNTACEVEVRFWLRGLMTSCGRFSDFLPERAYDVRQKIPKFSSCGRNKKIFPLFTLTVLIEYSGLVALL